MHTLASLHTDSAEQLLEFPHCSTLMSRMQYYVIANSYVYSLLSW